MNQPNEELSFAPFHLKRPHNPPNSVPYKTISKTIHELITFPSFLNILYSYSEVSYLRSCFPNPEISSDKISNLVSQYSQSSANHQKILEELNSIIIKENSYQSVFDAFKSIHLTETVINWLQPSAPPIEKCLILNIISFCLPFLEIPKKTLSTVWKSIFQSVLSTNEGTCIKKHFLVLLQIADIICNLQPSDEPILRYSCPQESSLLSSTSNPLVFPLLFYGEPPKSYDVGDEVLQRISEYDKSYLEYVLKGTFSSETKNEDCRNFLIVNGGLLNQFVQLINQLCFTSSRAVSPKTDIDLVYKPSNLAETEKFDRLRENDIICFTVWSIVHVINKLLTKSNFMDSALFQCFISNRVGGKNLIMTCLKCFPFELTDVEKVEEISTEKLAYKEDNPIPSMFEIALALSLHVTADLVSDSFRIMQQYVTDKDVKNIVKFAESVENTFIKSEAAYAVSKYSRWIPAQLKKKPNIQIINFLFLNLEEFELFEKFNKDNKPDVTPKYIGPNHIEQIKKHLSNLNLQIYI